MRPDDSMMRASELKSFARAAAAIVARDKDVAAFEIYCASGDNRIARLNYTSEIPCRGVEELKSHAADGFQIRIVTKRDEHEVGTAYEAGDFSADAVRAVLARAHRARIVDPHSAGFPKEPRKLAASKLEKSDLARASDASLVDAAWCDTARQRSGAFARRRKVATPARTSCGFGARWRCERVSRSDRDSPIRTSPISAPMRARTSTRRSPH